MSERPIFTKFSVEVMWSRVDEVEQRFDVVVVDVHGERVDAGHVLYGKRYTYEGKEDDPRRANYCGVARDGRVVRLSDRFPASCLALVDEVVRHRLPEHPGVHMTFVKEEPEKSS